MMNFEIITKNMKKRVIQIGEEQEGRNGGNKIYKKVSFCYFL